VAPRAALGTPWPSSSAGRPTFNAPGDLVTWRTFGGIRPYFWFCTMGDP
jgi:hypothetical protein